MKLKIKDFEILETFKLEIASELEDDFGILIRGEALSFLKEYPSLQLKSCALLKLPKVNQLTEGILICDFLGIEQILYLKKENILSTFNYLLSNFSGNIVPLALSMGESQLIIGIDNEGEGMEIYVLDDLCEASMYICNGVANFINNHLDHEFTL